MAVLWPPPQAPTFPGPLGEAAAAAGAAASLGEAAAAAGGTTTLLGEAGGAAAACGAPPLLGNAAAAEEEAAGLEGEVAAAASAGAGGGGDGTSSEGRSADDLACTDALVGPIILAIGSVASDMRVVLLLFAGCAACLVTLRSQSDSKSLMWSLCCFSENYLNASRMSASTLEV